jgi:hypothetical protein
MYNASLFINSRIKNNLYIYVTLNEEGEPNPLFVYYSKRNNLLISNAAGYYGSAFKD